MRLDAMPKSFIGSAVLVCLFLAPTPASAQSIAIPDAGSIAVGVFYHRAHRDMGDRYTPDWMSRGFAIHLTVAHRLILAAMGGYESPRPESRFPNRRYENIGIGGGATVYPLVSGAYRVGASIRYYRRIGLDHSPTRYDKIQERITGAFQVEREFNLKAASALLWVGPAYLRDRGWEYPGLAPENQSMSHDDFGAIVGASILLLRHAAPYVQFGFVEYPQTYAGFSYIF